MWINALSKMSNLKLFLLIFTLYAICAQARLWSASEHNHFAYLAEAFLNGQVELITLPPNGNDWASYEEVRLKTHAVEGQLLPRGVDILKGVFIGGSPRETVAGRFVTLTGEEINVYPHQIEARSRHYFVSFPPFPAVLMMPLVALFGLSASDVLLTLFFASLNGVLLRSLLRQILLSRSEDDALGGGGTDKDTLIAWLMVSFLLGTAHFWCSVRGEVWFTALIIGVTAHLLVLKWGWGLKRPLLAGLALAAAFSTRASLITLAIYLYFQLFFPFEPMSVKTRIRRCLLLSLPPLLMGTLLLYYNHIRFEQWHEFGHRYLAGGQMERIQRYGLFDLVFLKRNIIAAFALLPLISSHMPFLTYSWHGMAIQVSSPQLLWSFRAPEERKYFIPWMTLLVFMICTFSLLLLYQNTGWVQYSWRFILDLTPALTVMAALSLRRADQILRLAIGWGVMVNLVGALIFGREGDLWKAINLPLLFPL